MNPQTARKGDLALVVGVTHASKPINGLVVKVLSDPIFRSTNVFGIGLVPEKWVNMIDFPSFLGTPYCFVATRCLIPLRDPDADQSTSTTEPADKGMAA